MRISPRLEPLFSDLDPHGFGKFASEIGSVKKVSESKNLIKIAILETAERSLLMKADGHFLNAEYPNPIYV